MNSAFGSKAAPLLMLSSIRLRSASGGAWLRLTHVPASFFCYVTQGSGSLRLDRTTYRMKPDELYYIAPGTKLEAEVHAGGFAYYVIVAEHVELLKRSGSWRTADSGETAPLPLRTGKIRMDNARETLRRIERLHESWRFGKRSGYDEHWRFQEWLHTLLQSNDGRDLQPEEGRGIEQSIDYMCSRFHEKIKLETLAEIAGLTPTSYSREFKRNKGISPIDYLNAYRIGQSKQLLHEKGSSVKTVSSAVGFGNEFYFSRMFKREVGLPPTLYMKRKDASVAVASCMRLQDNLLELGSATVYAANLCKSRLMNEAEHRKTIAERLERMRQSKPELIICDDYHRPYLDLLKRIAPTVMLEPGKNWRLMHRAIAAIVGRDKDAERHFKRLDDKTALARVSLHDRIGAGSAAYISFYHKLVRIQGASRHPLNELLYAELGFKTGHCVPKNDARLEFSPDNYPDLDTDVLFVQTQFVRSADEDVFAVIRGSRRWQSMPAVRGGRVRFVPNWVGMSWSPLGRERIIDDLLAD